MLHRHTKRQILLARWALCSERTTPKALAFVKDTLAHVGQKEAAPQRSSSSIFHTTTDSAIGHLSSAASRKQSRRESRDHASLIKYANDDAIKYVWQICGTLMCIVCSTSTAISIWQNNWFE